MLDDQSFLRPKIITFFSVDLVGSTAYKQIVWGEDNIGEKWEDLMNKFYILFPKVLRKNAIDIGNDSALDNVLTDQYSRLSPDFRLWKVSGDELIFTVTLDAGCDDEISKNSLVVKAALYYAVHCFAKTIWECRDQLDLRSRQRDLEEKLKKQLDLGLKGTIWCAEFPVLNREIVVIYDSKIFDDYSENFNNLSEIEINYFCLKNSIGMKISRIPSG